MSSSTYVYLTFVLSTVPQTTTYKSFLVSGIRGQVLSTVHAPSDCSVSPLAHGSGVATPKVSPLQSKSRMDEQGDQVHSLLTAQVHVCSTCTCVREHVCFMFTSRLNYGNYLTM